MKPHSDPEHEESEKSTELAGVDTTTEPGQDDKFHGVEGDPRHADEGVCCLTGDGDDVTDRGGV